MASSKDHSTLNTDPDLLGPFSLLRNSVTSHDHETTFSFFSFQPQDKAMFHFWFNTFFVVNPLPHDSRRSTDSTTSEVNGSTSETYVLTLRKDEIDKANKDKTNRIFSPNLKVSTRCLSLRKKYGVADYQYFKNSNTQQCNILDMIYTTII